jgi:CheY-like chemotaxis protein
MPLKILIAEDSATNRLLFSMAMTRLGHQVDIAANGQEAVDMFSENPYDLVFLDLYMPVMNGIEAAYALKRHNTRGAPVYAISGLPPEDMAQRFQEVGIRRCLLKPLDREKLAEVVAETGLDAQAESASVPGAIAPPPRRLMVTYAHELRSRAESCAEFHRAGDYTGLFREARTIHTLAEMLKDEGLENAAFAVESASEKKKVGGGVIDALVHACMAAAEKIDRDVNNA